MTRCGQRGAGLGLRYSSRTLIDWFSRVDSLALCGARSVGSLGVRGCRGGSPEIGMHGHARGLIL